MATDRVRKSNGASGIANTLLLISIIGAINWGLIGLFNFNLVEAIFGEGGIARAIYTLVGLCGLASLFFLPALRVVKKDRYAVGAGTGVGTTGTTNVPPTTGYGRGYNDRADLRQ